ncbi:MAG TPA: polymer-forming cytoskeletal protein [Stellaceae bacterium]|nr:polymer-forming cytoskeletal protein [Stellaceae bacterium]
MAHSPDDLGIPMKPARPIGSATSVTPVGRTPAAVPPRVAEMPRTLPEPARVPEPPPARRAVTEPIGMPVTPPPAPVGPPPPPVASVARRSDSEVRRLTVGREISLAGQITSCDTLIVEGSVEADLQNCRDVDIAESGLFKGTAEIDNADVRGSFEGELIVRKRLLIRAGGRVSGTIRYGQLEIEAGGRICGDVQANAEGDVIAELPNARAAS